MTYEYILADVEDGVAILTLNRPKQLNAMGFAFRALLDSGDSGLFTGPDPTLDRILLLGDPLDGSAVIDIDFFRGLNNNGSVAFRATLADGREGIYRADLAVPEPVPLVLLLAGLLAGISWRAPREQQAPMAAAPCPSRT